MRHLLLAIFSILFATLLSFTDLSAQTTLTAGQVAIIRLNTDAPDEFSFVLLTAISSGTEIRFTDEGWQGNAGQFQGSNESHVTWTASSSLAAGTVITITETSTNNVLTATSGSATVTEGNFSLSNDGDQIFAYQGTRSNPTFLFALQSNSTSWQTGNPTSSNTSSLPAGLTAGVNAIAAGAGSGSTSEYDNIEFDFSTWGTTGTPAELLAAITDPANWVGNNGSRYSSSIPNFTVSVFPVEFLYFSAETEGNTAILTWATASELNNDFFSVEKSHDGLTYKEAGQVNGAGTSQEMNTYSFRDEQAMTGKSYYRLRQVDFDGQFAYSNVVEVTVVNESGFFQFSPNPVQDLLSIEVASEGSASIYALNGQLVKETKLYPGLNRVDLGQLQAGIYLLSVETTDMPKAVSKIVKD